MKKQAAKSKTVRAKKSDETKLHPFFDRLFSGEKISSQYIPPTEFTEARHWVALNLEELFGSRCLTECVASDIHCVYAAIRHNPELKQEAAAMLAFFEAQQILQRFVDATIKS
jgi:hypothetical protein